MTNLDSSAIVTARHIAKALAKGNLNGVKRLAKFVGCKSVYPEPIFEYCQLQRLQLEMLIRNETR